MFFERRCPVCGVSSRLVCSACIDALAPGPAITVEGLSIVTALLAYDDVSARLVVAAKNAGRRDLLRWTGHHLAALITAGHAPPDQVDVVTWVPAHPDQHRARGYDQGEILARTVARRLGLPCRSLLRRRGGGRQKGRNRTDRLDGPSIGLRRSSPPSVLLIDDVVTTGSSLRRSAEALTLGGARRIDGAVVAAVAPDRSPRVARSVEFGTLACGQPPSEGSTLVPHLAHAMSQPREEPPWR